LGTGRFEIASLERSDEALGAAGYLAVWLSELLGMALIFHRCAGQRTARAPFPPLARFIIRIWLGVTTAWSSCVPITLTTLLSTKS
jgi:fatty-acid desaturase